MLLTDPEGVPRLVQSVRLYRDNSLLPGEQWQASVQTFDGRHHHIPAHWIPYRYWREPVRIRFYWSALTWNWIGVDEAEDGIREYLESKPYREWDTYCPNPKPRFIRKDGAWSLKQ